MKSRPFSRLTPDSILDALEGIGLHPDGRLLALNSYENRVYQVFMDDGEPIVVKFYRPGRWSNAQILEEHAFSLDLAGRELPVVAPMRIDGATLHEREGLRFSVFSRQGGRAPEFDHGETLKWMGRFIGRIHAVGGIQTYRFRPELNVRTFGEEPAADLQASGFLTAELSSVYFGLVDQALDGARLCFSRAGQVPLLRLHGDCHPGNVLWSDVSGPFFVDFDDSRMGPAVQDLWMLLSGDRESQERQLSEVLSGYEDFCRFDRCELVLIEALRTLRLIHHSGWLARRWDDPAFPAAFPWFNSQRYWQDRILELREQIALMDEPPLGRP